MTNNKSPDVVSPEETGVITLGYIAHLLTGLKDQGITYQSIEYSLNRVFSEEMRADKERDAAFLKDYEDFRAREAERKEHDAALRDSEHSL